MRTPIRSHVWFAVPIRDSVSRKRQLHFSDAIDCDPADVAAPILLSSVSGPRKEVSHS